MGTDVSGVPKYGPKGLRTWIVLCVTWTTIFAFLAIALRLWSRRIRRQKLWWDDYLIIFSMVGDTHLRNLDLVYANASRYGIGSCWVLASPCSSKASATTQTKLAPRK